MSGHRHATDRTDWTILAECSRDDGHLAAELDASASVSPVADFRAVLPDECPECGAELTLISQEQSAEVLD